MDTVYVMGHVSEDDRSEDLSLRDIAHVAVHGVTVVSAVTVPVWTEYLAGIKASLVEIRDVRPEHYEWRTSASSPVAELRELTTGAVVCVAMYRAVQVRS